MSGERRDEDGDMAAQLKRGEATAIESLYDRYGRLAYGLALRILKDRGAAEDVVQDAFLGVWRNARSFDLSRGSLRTWLLTAVHNRAIDHLRGGTRARQQVPLEAAARGAEVPDAWEAVAVELERKQVLEALGQLPEAQRRTLELAYFQGFTHTDIARELNLPLGTVKGRLRIGLEKMRSYLQARGVTP